MQYVRLIGDFFDVYRDIMTQYNQPSKLPLFARRYRKNKHIKRVKGTIEMMRKSTMILNTDILIEYIGYITNSGKKGYKSIKRAAMYSSIYEANIVIDDISCTIMIDLDQYPEFNIRVKDKNVGFDLMGEELYLSHGRDGYDTIKKINMVLLSDICDYILETIDPPKEEKENDINELEGLISVIDEPTTDD